MGRDQKPRDPPEGDAGGDAGDIVRWKVSEHGHKCLAAKLAAIANVPPRATRRVL